MSTKKKRQRICRKFFNVSGEEVQLEMDVREGAVSYVLKRAGTEGKRGSCIGLAGLLLGCSLAVTFEVLNWWCFTSVVILGLIVLHHTAFKVVQEGLLVVNNLGFQIDVKYTLRTKSVFIPFDLVKAFFINEVISKHRVIYVLSVLTKDELKKEAIIPLFQETLPRLECLQLIYTTIHSAKN